MDRVEIVYRHPNPVVMARTPRILVYKPPGRDPEYCEPEEKEITVGEDKVTAVVYTLHPEYARRLLSAQPERYFLLSPKKLIVPVISQNGLRRDNKVFKSITLPPSETQSLEPKSEPKPASLKPKMYPTGHPLRPQINPEAKKVIEQTDEEPVGTTSGADEIKPTGPIHPGGLRPLDGHASKPIGPTDPRNTPKVEADAAFAAPFARPTVGEE